MLRATLAYLFVGVYLLAVGVPAILWTLAARESRTIYVLGRFCIRAIGWICGIRVRVRGREKIEPGRAYLLVSNHQSNCDGPVLFHAVPRDMRAVIKREIMRIPVLAQVLRVVDFVPIDRRNPRGAHRALEEAAELLRRGHSFFGFPEGTRSRDGRLRPFKKGIFAMGAGAGVPILPITIVGTRKIQPPGVYGVTPGEVEVVIHDPIPTEGAAAEELAERTRAAIASALPD